jgi:hypothetical protein
MKLLYMFLLVSGLLFAQVKGPEAAAGYDRFVFTLSMIAFDRQLELKTDYLEDVKAGNIHGVSLRPDLTMTSASPIVVTASWASPFSAVYPTLVPIYTPPRGLTTAQPAEPQDPQMVFLDGLGDSLVEIDTTTLTVVSQVAVPSTVGPFGFRPVATGTANEVWVANSGNEVPAGAEISVVDLSAQTLVTNILTPSIPQSAVPTGVVFTRDGATALEAFQFESPDSSGNTGALVRFDAAGRSVTSTLLLKFAPTALLIAPNGLTAYLLSSTGEIAHYDVASATLGPAVTTYPPGRNTGYPGASAAVYICPDGTRLFWNVNYELEVYDLTSGLVTDSFISGLPSTSSATFSLSPDGTTAYFSNPLGDVALVDTGDGTILLSFNTGVATSVFWGGPNTF